MYLPPNMTSLIQSFDQGSLRSLKTKYTDNSLNGMLAVVDRGVGVADF